MSRQKKIYEVNEETIRLLAEELGLNKQEISRLTGWHPYQMRKAREIMNELGIECEKGSATKEYHAEDLKYFFELDYFTNNEIARMTNKSKTYISNAKAGNGQNRSYHTDSRLFGVSDHVKSIVTGAWKLNENVYPGTH